MHLPPHAETDECEDDDEDGGDGGPDGHDHHLAVDLALVAVVVALAPGKRAGNYYDQCFLKIRRKKKFIVSNRCMK